MMNENYWKAKLPTENYQNLFRKLPSIYVFSYFPFGFEGRMWDLIESVPDHCLSVYFENINSGNGALPLIPIFIRV